MKYKTQLLLFLALLGALNCLAKTDSIPQISDLVILAPQRQITQIPATGGFFMFGYQRTPTGAINPQTVILVYTDSTGKKQLRRQAFLAAMPYGEPIITVSGTTVLILTAVQLETQLAGNLISFNVISGKVNFSVFKKMRLAPTGRLSMIATKNKLYVLSNFSIAKTLTAYIYHTREMTFADDSHYCMMYCIDVSQPGFTFSEVKVSTKKNGKATSAPMQPPNYDIVDCYPVGNSDTVVFRELISMNDRIRYNYKVVFENKIVTDFVNSTYKEMDAIPPFFRNNGNKLVMNKIDLPINFEGESWLLADVKLVSITIAQDGQVETTTNLESTYQINDFLQQVNYSNITNKGLYFLLKDSANALLIYSPRADCNATLKNVSHFDKKTLPYLLAYNIRAYTPDCKGLKFIVFSSKGGTVLKGTDDVNSISANSTLSIFACASSSGYLIYTSIEDQLFCTEITQDSVKNNTQLNDARFPSIRRNRQCYFLKLGKNKDCRLIVNSVTSDLTTPETIYISD